MNIFVLHINPILAARMHCDQHMHKMILESAQILSTVARKRLSPEEARNYYKPTHENHPCVLWAGENYSNARWLIELCYALDGIRKAKGSESHKSMNIIDQFYTDFNMFRYCATNDPAGFIFCGPEHIAKKAHLSIVEKYQEYYKYKSLTWVKQMTWKHRVIPTFMQT